MSKGRIRKCDNVYFKKTDLFIDGLHNNKLYLSRFLINGNSVDLLNQFVELDFSELSKYPPLIRFNAEYFEYAIVWAQKGVSFDFFKKNWLNYLNAKLPLQPYVISLQIPNILIALEIFGVDDHEVYDELYSRYRWLLKHQEKHLLANHYFENLKAIVISSYLFDEEKVFKKYVKKLKKECCEQILKDGVLFELSLMYHKLILEDLLLVNRLFKADWLTNKISAMLNAVFSLENGFNRTPLFNDAGDNVAKPTESLVIACKQELGIEPVFQNVFLNSGYYKIQNENTSVLIDAGLIGPNYNPGHSHCDCLSFELSFKNEPLFVNSGTYQYQGDKRQYFRSTKSHNTMMVLDHEQSELWGEHRVGKRIKKVLGFLSNNEFRGSFVNQYREKCFREISLNGNRLCVLDSFSGIKHSNVAYSFLHLAPGYSYKGNKIVGRGQTFLLETISCSVIEEESVYSPEFGVIEKNKCLVFSWKTDKEKHGYSIILSV